MSTREIVVYTCDACGVERQCDPIHNYNGAGFTILKLDGETHHLRGGHACSKECAAKLFVTRAKQLGWVEEATSPK